MPISFFLKGRRFDPETMRIMGLAFEMARAGLQSPDDLDRTARRLAEKIVELAESGLTDPNRLCDDALEHFRGSASREAPLPPPAP